MERKLDERYFYPEVYQAVPGDNYTVYAYMNDGAVRLYDAKHLIEQGGVFEPLRNKEVFNKTLTVIGNTIAWDLEGNRDEYKCLDVDPFEVFNSPVVPDFPEKI